MSVKWHKDLTFCQDPAEVVDYIIDYTPLLQADAIASITVTGTSVTIDSSSYSANIVTVWTSSVLEGVTAEVKTKIVTSNATPRTFERTFYIKGENK